VISIPAFYLFPTVLVVPSGATPVPESHRHPNPPRRASGNLRNKHFLAIGGSSLHLGVLQLLGATLVHAMTAPGVILRNQLGSLSYCHNRDGGHLGGLGLNGQQPI